MRNSKRNRLVLIASAAVLLLLFFYVLLRDTATLVTLGDAKKLLSEKQVERVVATEEYIYLKTPEKLFKIATSQVEPKMFIDQKVHVDGGGALVTWLFGLIFLLGAGSLLYRRYWKADGALCSKTASASDMQPQQPITPVRSDIRFADIGGIGDVKAELEEIIDFLKNPARYRQFGATMPRGVLLVGPPGVGKTMIAKAVAAEADVPFYYQSGASFVQIYVGMGAKRVQELFREAKRNAPSIIFIDEIDAVGKKRDGTRNDEREATLNQLLTEMDGFESSSGVIVVAATNNIEVLDLALLRSGRFDRRVFVELPTPIEREAILKKYLAKIPNNVDAAEVAKVTIGFSGASLAALVNEAALLSLRQKDMQVGYEHILHVKEKVMFGMRRAALLSEEQKAYRARYQAGKAFVATWFDLAFEKVLLSSDTLQPPISDPLLRHEIEARIMMLLSGMAASELRFNEHATNAQGDVKEAKLLAKAMIDDYAMGEKIVSEAGDAARVLEQLYEKSKLLISSHEGAIEQIERVLIERESISKAFIKEKINAVL